MPPAINPSPEPKSGYLSHLDGLRGLAALWVLLAHCMIWGGWKLTAIPQPKLAVDIFMVLSGFLMVHQWYAKHEEHAAVSANTVSRFYLRRYFRIAPLFYLVLLFTFAIGPRVLHGYDVLRTANHLEWTYHTYYDPLGIHYGIRNLFMHLTFLFGLFPNWAFSDYLPDWSIGLEMQFYLVFPLLLLVFRKMGPYLATALCGVAVLVWHYRGVSFPESSFLLIKLHVFVIGMLMAEGVRRTGRSPRAGMALAAIGLLIAIVFDSVIVATAAALIYFLSLALRPVSAPTMRLQHVLRVALGNRFMQFLADTSYSVYLIHGLFLSVIGGGILFSSQRFLSLPTNTRVVILALVTVAGAYPTAWLLHRLIERPGIALGRTAVRHIPTRRTAAKVAVRSGATVEVGTD